MKQKVIAFCGPPGSGKSTIIRAIRSIAPACRSVAYDDFPNATTKSLPDLKAWFDRGCDPNEFPLTELTAHLESLVSSKPSDGPDATILFETPFGRLHRRTGALIDYLIWVDIPLDVALARQVLAFSLHQRQAHPGLNDTFNLWLEGYLRSYIDVVAAMYRRQVDAVGAEADLRIDGLRDPAELAGLVLATINRQS
jgi:uridine kinase